MNEIKLQSNCPDCDMDSKVQNIVDTILNDVNQCSDDDKKEHILLDKEAIIKVIGDLETIMFPAHFAKKKNLSCFALRYELNGLISNVYTTLTEQIAKALPYDENFTVTNEHHCRSYGSAQTAAFLDQLTTVREYLKTDLQAAYDGDPAAYNTDEIIFSYPGFYAIMVNRLAHELYKLKIPMIPRIMTEHAHSMTGADIHPGAQIGKYFFIDHATGVVIGETSIIGEHVKIYQGVTLGGLSTRAGQGLKGCKRHPTIGNNVTIYSNASILGGETVIGDGCTIAGNSFITRSVAPFMRISNKQSELVISPDPRAVNDLSEYWCYTI